MDATARVGAAVCEEAGTSRRLFEHTGGSVLMLMYLGSR